MNRMNKTIEVVLWVASIECDLRVQGRTEQGRRRSSARLHVRAAVLAGLACVLTASVAPGQIGTPPGFLCGRGYVFSKGVVNGNVAANQATAVAVETYHFVNRIALGSNCPAANPSVTMTAQLDCSPGPSSGPTVFGPFSVAEGATTIPINVAVPAGPVRECTLVITSRITFGDGSILEQTADQVINIVEPSPADPAQPIIEVSLLSGSTKTVHPGDQKDLTYRVLNHSPTHSFSGSYETWQRNVADLPNVIAGPNDTRHGPFALADPGGGDVFALVPLNQAGTDPCLAAPNPPHESMPMIQTDLVSLQPNSFTDVTIRARTNGLSADGTANEGTFRVEGKLNGQMHTASAGYTLATLAGVTPKFLCQEGGSRAATGFASSISGVGPAAGISADGTPAGNQPFHVNYALEIANFRMLVNGVPISGGTPNFSGVTQVDGQHVRLVAEYSFITPLAPPNSIITMVTPFVVQPHPASAGDTATAVNSVVLIAGAPNGYADAYPAVRGTCQIARTAGLDDAVLNWVQQLSAVGVEQGTFNPVAMSNVSVDVDVTTPGKYAITSTWTATNPGTTDFIGFDVFNDYRAAAGRPNGPCCPQFGPCVDRVMEGYCDSIDGFYGGDGALCQNTICPKQTGACCYTDGTCFAPVAQSDCVVGGHQWHHNLSCAQVTCPGATCSPGDMNNDGLTNGKDIRGFVNCVIQPVPGCGCGDVNESGQVDPDDVPDFVVILLTGQ